MKIQTNKKIKSQTLTSLLLIVMFLTSNLSAGIFSFIGGGSSSSSGTESSPIELIVDGDKRDDDSPTKYYSFYSTVSQNITSHITDHFSSGYIINRDLTLTLYNLASDGSCDTITSLGSKTGDGVFDWTFSADGGKGYCLEVDGESSTIWTNRDYDINLTGDATLEAGINNASKKENESPMKFTVALTKAASSDVTINYTFSDETAINGTNYTGTNGSVTISAGEQMTTISVPLIDTSMTTTKTFNVTITSSDVTIDSDSSSATGSIIGSGSVDADDSYDGPDICYDSRETSGFCMFGSCMFYQERTNVRSMVNGLSKVNIKKSLTRGIAFMDFISGIGIDNTPQTLKGGDDQAEKKDFVSADFKASPYFNASMFPKGIEYRVGSGADASNGGSLDKNDTTSYYDKSMFKFGLFTQYTTLVTYEKGGITYQEVLQACNPDMHGSLNEKPVLGDCGIFLGALNSNTEVKFTSIAWQKINYQTKLYTPKISGSTGLCSGNVACVTGNGVGQMSLPTFIASEENAIVSIPYSMVIADQHVGNLITNIDANTESSESNRTIVFEAPYSSSYGGRVMLIKSITDHDNHADKYHYVFKEGDYWIGSWDINKDKEVTIETVGDVRFFINGNFSAKTTTSGEIRMGYNPAVTSTASCSDPHFYMYVGGDWSIDSAGASYIKNGYIYAKGKMDIGSATFASYYTALTADGEINVKTTGPGTYTFGDDSGICKDTNNAGLFEECPVSEFAYTTGPFDAWDTFRNINDRNISTKIVNQDFNLTIASINAANNAVEVKEGIDLKYQLYDMNTNTSVIAWQDYNASTGADGKKAIKLFQNITSAHKDVRVRFKFCAYNNGAGLIVKNLSECDSTSSDYNASYELNTSTYSSDDFAIRPYAFRVFGENQYKRAGEDFNLTIKAVDEGNNSLASGTALNVIGIQNYNESTASLNIVSQTYMPNATDINQMLTDVFGTSTSHTAAEINTCPQAGTFTVTPNNFINGESNVSMKFSETGILDVNVSEKPGSEFAIIDTDDTNNSQRYIKPATNINDESNITANSILLFTPYSFVTTAEYNATNGKNWLYMSYDVHKSNTTYTTPKMAAYISYTIEAKNKQGNKVRNYTKTCFPDTDEMHAPRVNGLKLNTTFDLFLDADINSSADANISLYTEDNANNAVWVLNKNQTIFEHNNTLQEWISPLNFTNGIGKVKVYFNIDRNISHALKPIKITLIDANTSTSWMNNPGSPKDFNGTILNQSKTFYYGRVHSPDYSVQGNSIDAKIYYEVYCEDCNQTYLNSLNLGDESADSVFWYVNKNHTSTNDGNISGFVTTSKINPITKINPINNGMEDDNVTYNAGIYPYKEKIEINASSWLIYNSYNPTATTNDFSVEFLGGGGWAGIGATGKTVDLNISTKGSKRIEW